MNRVPDTEVQDAGRPSEPKAAGTSPAAGPIPLESAVEAILLTADRPVSAEQMAEVIAGAGSAGPGATTPGRVVQAIEALNRWYDQTGRSFRIEAVAGGYRAMTRPELAGVVESLRASRRAARLSRAAVETLAIIAYRQPVTRAELESIRGVACGEVLRSLLDRRLIRVAGRADELGRPLLYATTRRFLEAFGLASIRDLPPIDGAEGAPASTGVEPYHDGGTSDEH